MSFFKKIFGKKEIATEDQETKYNSIKSVCKVLQTTGMPKIKPILAIDYTRSNLFNGEYSFGCKSLHAIEEGIENPYQRVLRIIGHILEYFKSGEERIPVYGFGSEESKDHSVICISDFVQEEPGIDLVLNAYNKVTPTLTLSGPTSFKPIIEEAINVVESSFLASPHQTSLHILIIIADGQVDDEAETISAIIKASNYPLSILMIGIGDGPWTQQEHFDAKIQDRIFRNFHFVNFEQIIRMRVLNPEANFAMYAFMQIPKQYSAVRKLGLLQIGEGGFKGARDFDRNIQQKKQSTRTPLTHNEESENFVNSKIDEHFTENSNHDFGAQLRKYIGYTDDVEIKEQTVSSDSEPG